MINQSSQHKPGAFVKVEKGELDTAYAVWMRGEVAALKEDIKALESSPIGLRDKFAGDALQGLLNKQVTILNSTLTGQDPIIMNSPSEDVSRWAYEYADAMLKARDKGATGNAAEG